MDTGNIVALIVLGILVIFVLSTIAKAVRVVPQASAVIIERLGRYSRTLEPGLHFLVPFVDRPPPRAARGAPQASAVITGRLGRYSRTLEPGLHFLVPFVDRPRAVVDLREQVVSFPPQPVITSDNLVVSIDTVIYFQPTDPKSAVYEIANYIQGIEQLTVTTLRNVIGSLDLEQTLRSEARINAPPPRGLGGGRR